LFCLSLCVGISVYAADTRPCADDVSKFCKDVKLGGGRIANCLKSMKRIYPLLARQGLMK
jgi:hypothetical protein